MASKDTLSADLDLVKEIEQLRIKQRLLIDSLNRKYKHDKDKQLADLSSKLDFIVEIFKDASEQDEKKEHEENPVLTKLDEFFTTFESRFDELERKVSRLEKLNTKKSPSAPPVPNFHQEQSSAPSPSSTTSQHPVEEHVDKKMMGGPGSQNPAENGGKKKKKGFFSK